MQRKPKRSETRVMTVLDCHHTVKFEPPGTVGDLVWCKRCTKYRVVEQTIPEWSIYCLDKTCHYAKYFGADELTARRMASRHAVHMSHRVSVREGYRVRSIMDSRGDQPRSPKTGKNVTISILSWLTDNPDHVQSLRHFSDRG